MPTATFPHMMGSTLFSTGVVLMALALQSQALAQHKYQSYPDYLEVLDHAYQNYRLKCDGCTVSLVKDPEGWAVAISDPQDNRKVHRIWSHSKRKYVTSKGLTRLAKGEARSPLERNADTPWTASYYRFCPYYGYPGWFLDVIQEYEQQSALPDSIVYGVARAYASAARCRISDQVGECPVGYGFTEGEEGDQLSPEEIAEYMRLAAECTAWYDRLVDMAPNFGTHVGEAALKRDNEIVSNYIDLLLVQNELTARQLLRNDLYDPFYRALARNYLNSCDSNAVLFTNGDTDSFPLWYMQEMEGVRRDVLVLNVSLLNLPRYIRVMRQAPWGAAPLDLALSDKEWGMKGSEFAWCSKESGGVMTVDALLAGLRSHLAVSNTPGPYTIESDLRLGPNEVRSIAWQLPKPYLYRSGLATLDILQANAFERPMHWAITCSEDCYIGLGPHTAVQGLTKRLMGADTDSLRIQEQVRRSAMFYLQEFDPAGLQSFSPGKDMFVDNYILQLGNTAEALLQQGDSLLALQVLDRAVNLFPDSVWAFKRFHLLILETYYALGRHEQGDRVALALVRNMKERPIEPAHYIMGAVVDSPLFRTLVLERILSDGEDHQRTVVIAAAKAALDARW